MVDNYRTASHDKKLLLTNRLAGLKAAISLPFISYR